MIRSLYIRVVLTFLVSIIGGTIISFLVSTWIFEDKLNENAQINLRNFGQDIVRIYKTFPLREADLFVSEMKQLDSYYIRSTKQRVSSSLTVNFTDTNLRL